MTNSKLQHISNCDIGPNTKIEAFSSLENCTIGSDCHIWRFVNLYGCVIDDGCMIGSFVEIQSDVEIGKQCRIQTHSFLCSKLRVKPEVFISHGVNFINDVHPPSNDEDAWEPTIIRENVSIGTNATILPVEIGENAIVGAGAVVTEDVPANAVVAGNPAEVIRYQE